MAEGPRDEIEAIARELLSIAVSGRETIEPHAQFHPVILRIVRKLQKYEAHLLALL
jgi:hypothetical protein